MASLAAWPLAPAHAGAEGRVAQLGAHGFAHAELFIDAAAGTHRFEVEVARTPAQRIRGLMFRTGLAADAGMLFVMETEGEAAIWMKNTFIPLDILFVAADGRITRIATDTTPLSTRIIGSGGPVLALLEVPAGTARRLGIAPGDRVRSAVLPSPP